MTVSSSTARADYNGNGSTTAFTVPFYFIDITHLLVLSTVIATGVSTTLSLGTNYSVTGAGVSSGGTVTAVVAPASGVKLSILRNVPITQTYHYVPNDPFPSASHESALDLLTMEVQQVNEVVSRAIVLPTATSGVSTLLPAPIANTVLAWDSTATFITNVILAVGSVFNSFWSSILTTTTAIAARASLGAAASGTNSDIISLSGLTTPLSIAQGGTGNLLGGSLVSNGYATYSANTTLTQADVGRACYFTAASTATLPLLSATPIGGIISIFCPNSLVVTITASGTDKIYGAGQQNVASISISNGDSIMLVNAGSFWAQLAGTGGLGYGQTWQAPSRTPGTTYFNSTGKPISVTLSETSAAIGPFGLTATVGGVSRPPVVSQANGSGFSVSDTFIVPIGSSYVYGRTNANSSAGIWIELR